MSSEDDFGGYVADPTPNPKGKKVGPKPRPVKRPTTSSLPKPEATLASSQNPAKKSQENMGARPAPEFMVLSSDEEQPAAQKPKAQPPVTRVGPPGSNGKISNKSKGKAKIGVPLPAHSDSMEVDEPPTSEAMPATQRSAKMSRPTPKVVHKSVALPLPESTVETSLKHENERLRKMLEDITGHRDKLAEQMQELLQIRETEAEKSLRELQQHFDSSMETQRRLIQVQSVQLAKYKELQASGDVHMLQFLSREAANEEKKSVEKEVVELRAKLKERDQEVVTLKEENKQLKNELAAETEMAKKLQASLSKNPSSQVPVRSGPSGSRTLVSDDHNTLVITFYEDLTNFLVHNVRYEPSTTLPDRTETVLTCTFTVDVTEQEQKTSASNPSLTFLLRLTWGRRDGEDSELPVSSPNQLVEKVQYIPQNLEREPEEFVEQLDIFRQPFMFTRDQLHVFLKTITERLGGIGEAEGEGEGDEQESIME